MKRFFSIAVPIVILLFVLPYVILFVRPAYIITKYSPGNIYRLMNTGVQRLPKHNGSIGRHSYEPYSSGMAPIEDKSGYNIYIAGIDAIPYLGFHAPFLTGCSGCDSCLLCYKKAGLIEYEIMDETEEDIIVNIKLTKKGEKYALDNRMNKNSPGYETVMNEKEQGIRYVMIGYYKINYLKTLFSKRFIADINNNISNLHAHYKYIKFIKEKDFFRSMLSLYLSIDTELNLKVKYTPFGKSIGLEDSESKQYGARFRKPGKNWIEDKGFSRSRYSYNN